MVESWHGSGAENAEKKQILIEMKEALQLMESNL